MPVADRAIEAVRHVLQDVKDTPGFEKIVSGDRPDFFVEEKVRNLWSSGELVLYNVARDLWNGSGAVTLHEVMSTLDNRNLGRVLEAVMMVRGVRMGEMQRLTAAIRDADTRL